VSKGRIGKGRKADIEEFQVKAPTPPRPQEIAHNSKALNARKKETKYPRRKWEGKNWVVWEIKL